MRMGTRADNWQGPARADLAREGEVDHCQGTIQGLMGTEVRQRQKSGQDPFTAATIGKPK